MIYQYHQHPRKGPETPEKLTCEEKEGRERIQKNQCESLSFLRNSIRGSFQARVNQFILYCFLFFIFIFPICGWLSQYTAIGLFQQQYKITMEQNLYWTFLPLQAQPFYFSQSFLNPYFDSNNILPVSGTETQPVQDQPQQNANECKKRRQSKRRNQGQLNKCFKCPYEQCPKEYASDLALNLHMKNKHRGGNKKDRDRVAKMILKSEMQGKPMPKCDIQLPPDYIKRNKIRLLLLETEDENEGQVKKEQ